MAINIRYFNASPGTERLSNRIERLEPPPRRVPLPAVCAAMTGFLSVFGAVFFSFGMIFVWVFGAGLSPLNEWRLSGSFAAAPAVVEEVSATGGTVNDVTVYEYRFRYTPGDGIPLYGTCYTTGKRWSEGTRAAAHYLPGNPEVARLEGSRISQFPPWILLIVLIFPVVGLCLFIPSVFSGRRKIKLLRYGEITGAENITVSPTNTRVNDVPVMKYAYAFRDRMGQVYTGASRALPTEKIGDEQREPVLYLPSNPRRSMLVDAMPLRFPLEVDESGGWRHRGFIKPVLAFVLTWAAVLVHVVIGFLVL